MTLPTNPRDISDGVYCLLLAISLGDPLTAEDGELTVTLPSGEKWHPPQDVFDGLEEKSWIATDTDPARITDTGRWWLQKWIQRKLGKGRWVMTGAKLTVV